MEPLAPDVQLIYMIVLGVIIALILYPYSPFQLFIVGYVSKPVIEAIYITTLPIETSSYDKVIHYKRFNYDK